MYVQLETQTLMLFCHVTPSASFGAKDCHFKSICTTLTKGYADALLKCLQTLFVQSMQKAWNPRSIQ